MIDPKFEDFFFFKVYLWGSEISSLTWREQETNRTFVWKATDVAPKKPLNRKMSAQGIILTGHILSGKWSVFTCNITVKCCENWQSALVLFFKIVHRCAPLKYGLAKRIPTSMFVYLPITFRSELCACESECFPLNCALNVLAPSHGEWSVSESWITQFGWLRGR